MVDSGHLRVVQISEVSPVSSFSIPNMAPARSWVHQFFHDQQPEHEWHRFCIFCWPEISELLSQLAYQASMKEGEGYHGCCSVKGGPSVFSNHLVSYAKRWQAGDDSINEHKLPADKVHLLERTARKTKVSGPPPDGCRS